MKAEERRQYKDFAETVRAADAELLRIKKARAERTAEVKERYRVLRETFAVELLRSHDIEELNQSREGIRIKAFRDIGMTSVADICKSSQRALESVPGVGAVMAAKAKRNAEAIRISAARTIRVRIDPERNGIEQRGLVWALGKLLHTGTVIERAGQLYEASHDGIEVRLQISECIGNGFSWVFSSGSRKEQALAAYEELREYVRDTYAAEASAIIRTYQKESELTETEAWEEFLTNSAPYYALLESVTEGDTEAISDYGGIPEELVKAVNALTLNLSGLKAELRRYQSFGVKYILYGKRVLLGDEMGLGKTVEAIAAMAHLRAEGKTHFLVVCPLSVLINWKREVARFSEIPVDEIYGADREEELREWILKGGTAITTYETASRLTLPNGFAVDLLTIDEAQFVKNPDALRTKAVKKLIGRSQAVLMMTGTPLENRVSEMLQLIGCLQPEVEASVRGLTALSDAERFRRGIAPVYLRRTREQVLKELPDKEEIADWSVMNEEELAVYKKTLREGNYMEIRRLSWNVPNVSESSKAERMLEIIADAEQEGRKTIVFSFFRETLRSVASLLGERCAGIIDGSMPMSRRQELLDEFQQNSAKTVLICQVIAGGVGLNVQAASVIIFCEPQLKPSMEEQAIGRAYRMGQNRKVLVHRLLTADSIDERILDMLAEKKDIFNTFADESVVAKIDLEGEITSAGMEELVRQEKERYGLTEDSE